MNDNMRERVAALREGITKAEDRGPIITGEPDPAIPARPTKKRMTLWVTEDTLGRARTVYSYLPAPDRPGSFSEWVEQLLLAQIDHHGGDAVEPTPPGVLRPGRPLGT